MTEEEILRMYCSDELGLFGAVTFDMLDDDYKRSIQRSAGFALFKLRVRCWLFIEELRKAFKG